MKTLKTLIEAMAPKLSVANLKNIYPKLGEIEIKTLKSGFTYILGSENDIKILKRAIPNQDSGYSNRFKKHYILVE